MYELHDAQKMEVKVILCPHIGDGFVWAGMLDYDVCIANINTRVDSKNAFCSWEPNKVLIHEAIKAESSNGFEDINESVERIRLDCLLNYPVHKIKGGYSHNSEAIKKEG